MNKRVFIIQLENFQCLCFLWCALHLQYSTTKLWALVYLCSSCNISVYSHLISSLLYVNLHTFFIWMCILFLSFFFFFFISLYFLIVTLFLLCRFLSGFRSVLRLLRSASLSAGTGNWNWDWSCMQSETSQNVRIFYALGKWLHTIFCNHSVETNMNFLLLSQMVSR